MVHAALPDFALEQELDVGQWFLVSAEYKTPFLWVRTHQDHQFENRTCVAGVACDFQLYGSSVVVDNGNDQRGRTCMQNEVVRKHNFQGPDVCVAG